MPLPRRTAVRLLAIALVVMALVFSLAVLPEVSRDALRAQWREVELWISANVRALLYWCGLHRGPP